VYATFEATFEASADILKSSTTEVARDALQLMPLLAVWSHVRLPLSIFEARWEGARSIPAERDDDAEDDDVLLLTPWHVARLPLLIDHKSDAWDSFRLVEAVQLLRAFALVSMDLSGDHLNVSMHPLVHAWARDWPNAGERHTSWLQMACLFALSSDNDRFWRKRERQLQPHVEAVTGWEENTIFAAEPACW
jgi:hypothetical protein